MKVYLATLGCKLNESEMEAWSRRFASEGHEIVTDPRAADLCVLNTCTVTHVAAAKSRQVARQLARSHSGARIVLTGCYASVAPEEVARLPNVALVVPNADKDRLVALVGDLLGDAHFQTTSTGCRMPEAVSGVLLSEGSIAARSSADNRLWSADGGKPQYLSPAMGPASLKTRAFVKVMDGCNMSCTYCIIPLARGKEHSRPLPEVVSEVKGLVEAGYQEIILTGVQISVYEHNGDKVHGLRDLVAAILNETSVPRLRLTSIAPWDLDESLLDLWRDPRLCRHVHLSLQSGADTTLRRMRRAYTAAQFAHAAERARERIPDVGITTDVIVGFPGESDAEFETSLRFVEEMEFSRVHVFPYSARQGTAAASLPLHVPDRAIDARRKRMQAVANAAARGFAERFVGRTMQVLWETRDRGQWSGYTDNYIRVMATSDANLHNHILRAELVGLDQDGVKARLIQEEVQASLV